VEVPALHAALGAQAPVRGAVVGQPPDELPEDELLLAVLEDELLATLEELLVTLEELLAMLEELLLVTLVLVVTLPEPPEPPAPPPWTTLPHAESARPVESDAAIARKKKLCLCIPRA
jgi:hypothetical protein